MKTILCAIVLLITAPTLFAQGAPPQGAANKPYVMEYYYKVQWGHQQEFLNLFLKNHYPLLQKRVESGDFLSVKIETPSNHMPEEARWDYRVTIRFKNSTLATTANPDEEKLIKQLWPDQDQTPGLELALERRPCQPEHKETLDRMRSHLIPLVDPVPGFAVF